MATEKKLGQAGLPALPSETAFEKIKKERAFKDKKSRELRAKIDTVRKGGIGSDRVTKDYRNVEDAFDYYRDPVRGEKSLKKSGRLYHSSGGRATHGYGKAYLKGGRVK